MCSYLMTANEEKKSRFNCEVIDLTQLKNFIGYYLCILKLAFDYQFINEKERNFISKLILQAIYTVSNSNAVVVSNYHYVISLWLQSMSKYDAWTKINSLADFQAAREFVEEAKKWFLKEADIVFSVSQKAKIKAEQIGDKDLVEQANNVLQIVSDLWKCFEMKVAGQCNLKSLHKERSIYCGYDFIYVEDMYTARNYLERIKIFAEKFSMEMGILQRIASDTLIFQLHKQDSMFAVQEELKQRQNAEKRKRYISKKIMQLTKELEHLDEEHYEMLERKASFEKEEESYFLKLEEEFRKKHSELSEAEMEEALDEYFGTIEFQDNPYEESSISNDYFSEREIILMEITDLSNEQEDILNMITLSEAKIQMPKITLMRVIKEYAVFEKSNRGEIRYPTSQKEKEKAFSSIRIEEAIAVLLMNAEAFNFSEEEIKFLKSIK